MFINVYLFMNGYMFIHVYMLLIAYMSNIEIMFIRVHVLMERYVDYVWFSDFKKENDELRVR